MTTLGDRLRELRRDSDKTIEQFAVLGGVKRRSQVNYEADERAPDAVYFGLLDRAGIDTHYIITGQPGPEARARREPHAVRGAAKHVAELQEHYDVVLNGKRQPSTYRKLMADEDQLVGYYRRADKPSKGAIMKTAEALSSGGHAQANSHHVSADRGSVAAGRDANVGSKPRHRKK